MARLIPARRSLATSAVAGSTVAALLVSAGCAHAAPGKAPAPTTTKAAAKVPTYAVLPDLGMVVAGYGALWRSSGKNDIHGTVLLAGDVAAQRRDRELDQPASHEEPAVLGHAELGLH